MKGDMSFQRATMVQSQLIPTQITHEALLTTMREIPRELFASPSQVNLAYQDDILLLPENRFMVSPSTLANLIQTADPQPHDNILDIGCGWGYSTAVLSFLSLSVIGIEEGNTFVTQANKNLQAMGAENAKIWDSPLSQGFPDEAPYDVILIQGAVQQVPEGLLCQLSEEGGRLVIILQEGSVKNEVIYRRHGKSYSREVKGALCAPVLAQFKNPQKFVFY